MKSGTHPGMSMLEYLQLPALSAGVVQTLIERCPKAAWWESHLNPNRAVDFSRETDAGTVAHAILLEGSREGICVINPNEHLTEKTGNVPIGYGNKSIRNARDDARAAGKIPVLAPAMAEIDAMVNAAAEYIESLKPTEPAIWRAFQPDGGESELTMVWREIPNDAGPGEVLCRMRPDRISLDRGVVVNYKTHGGSVEPDRWGRAQMVGAGYYIGAAWYARGIHKLFGAEPTYVFLAQETTAPYLCSLVGCDPHAMDLGHQKCAAGLAEWQRCVRVGKWPGYLPRVVYPEIPAWEDQRWIEQQAENINFAEQG